MADERSENGGGGGGVDRHLYLSLPSLPRLENRDLGPELTVSSAALYSPANALSTPDLLPADPLHAADPGAFAYNFSSSSHELLLDEPSSRHESPPPQSFPRFGHGRDESVSAHIRLSELTADGDALSVQQELREHPEYRFQLLIELLQSPRPAAAAAADAQGFTSEVHSLTSPERLLHDIIQSQSAMETAKMAARGHGVEEDLEKKKKNEGIIAAANFECNICYELAKAPVVTPCGHLYCWSCLYRWLHAHSVNSECPVCKGQVLEVNVTPIYGRGGEESKDNKQLGFGESNLQIPPRPLANRVDNLRLEEGIANSWRNNVDEETGNRPSRRRGRFGAARTVVRRRPRPAAQSLQREEGSGSNSAGVIIPIVVVPSSSRHSAGSSASNAIATPLGGTAIASPPSAEPIAAMSSNSVVRRRARNSTLASSNAGAGVHHMRRRMR